MSPELIGAAFWAAWALSFGWLAYQDRAIAEDTRADQKRVQNLDLVRLLVGRSLIRYRWLFWTSLNAAVLGAIALPLSATGLTSQHPLVRAGVSLYAAGSLLAIPLGRAMAIRIEREVRAEFFDRGVDEFNGSGKS